LVNISGSLFFFFYVKKKYALITTVKNDNSLIKQRWDNFGHHVAAFVTLNTDLVVISVFMDVFAASVYTVYNLVFMGVNGIIFSFSKGLDAAFGNMMAKGEGELLKKNFKLYEQVTFGISTFLFGVTTTMILPFVSIYTKNIDDTEYIVPVFAFLMVGAALFRCIRTPYQGVVTAAGHFKQTRNQAFFEAIIKIVITISLVIPLGLAGVAIGTLFAYIFRTIRFAYYLSRNIIKRSIFICFGRITLSIGCILVTFFVSNFLPLNFADGFIVWTINAIIVSVVSIILVVLGELLFYRKDLTRLIKMLKSVLVKVNI